jgi:thioredoxin-dependent peroxiredoxin
MEFLLCYCNVIAPVFSDALLTAGAPAPAFTLPSNRGKDISLADYAGKRLVLYFYPGDFTSGCTIEAQGFERDFDEYKKLGVEILGVSVDSVEKHLDFGNSYNLEFPLASDKGGAISGKYGSLIDLGFVGKFSNRQTYIISPEGKVEVVFKDVEGNIAKHSENVLAKLKSLI